MPKYDSTCRNCGGDIDDEHIEAHVPVSVTDGHSGWTKQELQIVRLCKKFLYDPRGYADDEPDCKCERGGYREPCYNHGGPA